jgi:UrcA family protein
MLAGLALTPALSLFTTPALAQNAAFDSDQHTLAVIYGDLDLTTRTGRVHLDERLRHAAARVCGQEDGVRPPMHDESAVRCYENALAAARDTMAHKQQGPQLVRR